MAVQQIYMVLPPPPGLTRASLHDYRLGHTLDALCAANLNKVLSAVALKALEVYAIPTPWLYQDTTTIAQQGAGVGKTTRGQGTPWRVVDSHGMPLGLPLDSASPAAVTVVEPTLETRAVPRSGAFVPAPGAAYLGQGL
jgi:hypothetical protein